MSTPTKETAVLRKKIAALNNEGTLWVLSDLLTIIGETLEEQTGLKLRKDGQELAHKQFLDHLLELYTLQLEELRAGNQAPAARQKTLEEGIAEMNPEPDQ